MKSNVNTMADVLACRICLTTTEKLYKIQDNNIVSVYENFTGLTRVSKDEFPQYMCMYCRILLHKCESFKRRCLRTQELLKQMLVEQKQLTNENILYLSETHNTALPYTMVEIERTSHPEPDTPIKAEPIPLILEPVPIEIKTEFVPSDDEPLLKFKNSDNVSLKSEDFNLDFDLDSLNVDSNDVENTDNVGENDEQTDNDEDNSIQVIMLSKEQQLKEIEERKESYNYLNSFYKCEFCYKGFLTESTYKNHMIKHDPNSGKQVCEICKIRCPDAKSLKSHVVISHSRKYICGLCSHVSRSAHRAKEHLQWHRGKKYSCHVCGASFAKSTSQLTHLRLRHPSKFTCDVCGDSFIGEYGLKIHKKRAHRDNEKQSTKVFKCVSCNIQFNDADALNKHLTYSDGGACDTDMCPCVHCGESLGSRELLAEHLKKVHQNEDPVKCSECNRTFVNDRSYAMHYHRVHLGIRIHPKKPDSRRKLGVVCEICGKKCLSNASLVYHQRTHTGEKPYQCPDCPKRFSMVQRLQIHQRIHTGERPFKCSHCPKAFKHKAALNRHDRVHTGAKPYQCAHCGKAFSQSNSMKLHVRTVHHKLPTPYPARGRNKNDVI